MIIIGWIALCFVVFEVGQLVVAERFIGVKQLRSNLHPLDGTAPRTFWFSALWVAALLADYLFQVTLLLMPKLDDIVDRAPLVRLAAVFMLIISFVGFAFRRTCGLKWGLVVLTIEGAARAGFFAFIFFYVVVRHGNWWHFPHV